MGGAGVLAWLLVALCGGAGAYCAARLCLRRTAPAAHRAADATEAVMGLGMAAMAAGLATPTGVGLALYGSAALVSVVLAALASGPRGHHAYHLVGHAAMVYMTVATATGPHAPGASGVGGVGGDGMAGMAGMGAPGRGVPAVTGVLLLACVAVSVRAGLRLAVPARPSAPAGAAVPARAPKAPPARSVGGAGAPVDGVARAEPASAPRSSAARVGAAVRAALDVHVAPASPAGGALQPLWRAPALPDACRVVMGLSMAVMLALL